MYQKLRKPPIAVAIFQLVFDPSEVKLNDFLRYDEQIKHTYPIRSGNVHVGIDLGGSSIPLGVSTLNGTTDARVNRYVYFSKDQKAKVEISENKITYIDERPYENWESFKAAIFKLLSIVSGVISGLTVVRTSIRFVNRFNFDAFENPSNYFRTVISRNEENDLPYPLRQYGFRLTMDIPETNIHSIVNQNAENTGVNAYIYTFDIDVLDRQCLIFDLETLSDSMEKLREVKNEIFFKNITPKTIELCN
ncbi:MAG: TIGR04255 family protein [Mangrovibacterium sp.]